MEEGSRSRSLWSVERTRLNLDTIGMSSSPASFFFFGSLRCYASIMRHSLLISYDMLSFLFSHFFLALLFKYLNSIRSRDILSCSTILETRLYYYVGESGL